MAWQNHPFVILKLPHPHLLKDVGIDELPDLRRRGCLGPVLCTKLDNAASVTASVVLLWALLVLACSANDRPWESHMK